MISSLIGVTSKLSKFFWLDKSLSSPGGRAHDLRMDGGLPPGFQKATLFQFSAVAVLTSFMMNFGGKLPIFDNFYQCLETHPCLRKICRKRDPGLENF